MIININNTYTENVVEIVYTLPLKHNLVGTSTVIIIIINIIYIYGRGSVSERRSFL